ncbi:hypothetical protein [Salinicola sp. CR57]|uniref:hypothetical protein n=1 Tax=Salinicola sp. CR57 TaxID=1949086 RepID=UPI001300ABB1|nr:hypothetical protein [Salinicola sp. CR57]
MTTTTSHHTPAPAGVSVLEPAMANQLPVTPEEDEAFEALARRNDELEAEKHTLATVADQQERKIEQLTLRIHDLTWRLKNDRQQRSAAIESAAIGEQERADALDAHLDRFMDATDEVAMADDDWVENLQRVRNDSPATSLAQLKARVAHEAVHAACRAAMPGPPNPPDDPHPDYIAFCEGVTSVLDAYESIVAGGSHE